ncbi:hypothetical protein LBH_0411 [Lactobacillus helveticus H9]|nr:hypothetical protein LBH_0411 [Lactobacillus helveticus H9]
MDSMQLVKHISSSDVIRLQYILNLIKKMLFLCKQHLFIIKLV